MQAVICEAFDGPEALEVREFSDPAPGPGEILVEVHAAAVSFMDTLMVSGRYQMRPETPFVPGTDAVGVVREAGIGVTRFQRGDRVACTRWTGGLGELMVAGEWEAVRIPDGVDFEAAASLLYAYGTAYYALVERANCSAAKPSSCPAQREAWDLPWWISRDISERGSSRGSGRMTKLRWSALTALRKPSTIGPRA
jgi:NADPH2:quinone reductase